MEIGSNFQSAQVSRTANGSERESGTAINSDFETFIKMLTVQVQNQDPLNPIESADFAVQLATFSTVEQQVLTNELLSDLGSQMGALGVAQLSGWIGMDARAEVPVNFVGDPVKLTLKTDDLGNEAQLVVRNSQGNEIQRIDIDPAGGEYNWPGRDSFGNLLPSGTYTLNTETFSQGQLIATNPAQVHDRIVEARNENGQPKLVLAGGQVVNAEQILSLAEAP